MFQGNIETDGIRTYQNHTELSGRLEEFSLIINHQAYSETLQATADETCPRMATADEA